MTLIKSTVGRLGFLTVRELVKKIKETERRLEILRMAATNLVPIIDGMPHATFSQSRVEKIALKTVEAEQELTKLYAEQEPTKAKLADKIIGMTDNTEFQTLLVLRYVECLSFREISRRIHYSLSRVFDLHDKIIRDCVG